MLLAEVDPPPSTRHLAVRTGKRYGKTSLTAQHGRDLARAIAECRYLLRERGSRRRARSRRARGPDHVQGLQGGNGPGARHPGGAHRPLLTAAREQRARGLRPPARVGTPTLRPEDVARLARAYYHDDLQLIEETSVRGEDGRWRYRDPRRHARGGRAHARN
jgi:hypothetical protein